MWIERLSGRVTRLTYTPNQLPPHATQGTVTETSSEPLPGLWYVTSIEERFEGRAFLMHGSATFSGVFDHFRRFPSVSSGQIALEDHSI